jgi:hypothetical protein
MLSVPVDRITMLLEQASQVGSEPAESETGEAETGEDFADLPAYRELTAMLDEFTPEELYELLALAAIGAGEVAEESWNEAVTRAQATAAEEAVAELARILVVTDAIENALDRLGYTVSEDGDDEDEDDEDEDDDEDEEEDEDEDEDEEEGKKES